MSSPEPNSGAPRGSGGAWYPSRIDLNESAIRWLRPWMEMGPTSIGSAVRRSGPRAKSSQSPDESSGGGGGVERVAAAAHANRRVDERRRRVGAGRKLVDVHLADALLAAGDRQQQNGDGAHPIVRTMMK